MKKAFSLVELMVVIAIIGILAGVLLSSFSGGTESARAAKCLNNMRSLATATVSYATAERHFPAAGNFIAEYIDSNGTEYYREYEGWISWLSKNDEFFTRYNRHRTSGRKAARSPATLPNVSACCENIDDANFALTNGVLWNFVHHDRDTYVCPLHRRLASSKTKLPPLFSYAMNAYFGSAVDVHPDDIRLDLQHPRLDRILLFAEVPFGVLGSADSSCEDHEKPDAVFSGANDNYVTDCVLQYKGEIAGEQKNKQWSQKGEAIAFNHKSGKKNLCAHVIFADGHAEKLLKPRNGEGLTAAQMTVYLCEGKDLKFDGRKYEYINTDGNK